MNDKQRLYERLNGMVAVLDMIIKLGEQFNIVSILRDIDDLPEDEQNYLIEKHAMRYEK